MSIHPAGLQGRPQYLSSSLGKLKDELDVTVATIASGKVSDIGKALKGSTQQLSIIEADIAMLTQKKKNIGEALAKSQYAYQIVENIGDTLAAANASLAQATLSDMQLAASVHAGDIEQKFKTILGSLNVKFAGTYIFSGQNSLSAPVPDPALILTEIADVAAAAFDANEAILAIENWFDSPDGFLRLVNIDRFDIDALQYDVSGQLIEVDPIPERVEIDFIADGLKGLSIAALVSQGVFADASEQRRIMLQRSGDYISKSAISLIDEGARVGLRIENLEDQVAQAGATIATLHMTRNEMISADMESASTQVSQIEVRVDIIYNLIARISRLSLSEYLR